MNGVTKKGKCVMFVGLDISQVKLLAIQQGESCQDDFDLIDYIYIVEQFFNKEFCEFTMREIIDALCSVGLPLQKSCTKLPAKLCKIMEALIPSIDNKNHLDKIKSCIEQVNHCQEEDYYYRKTHFSSFDEMFDFLDIFETYNPGNFNVKLMIWNYCLVYFNIYIDKKDSHNVDEIFDFENATIYYKGKQIKMPEKMVNAAKNVLNFSDNNGGHNDTLLFKNYDSRMNIKFVFNIPINVRMKMKFINLRNVAYNGFLAGIYNKEMSMHQNEVVMNVDPHSFVNIKNLIDKQTKKYDFCVQWSNYIEEFRHDDKYKKQVLANSVVEWNLYRNIRVIHDTYINMITKLKLPKVGEKSTTHDL